MGLAGSLEVWGENLEAGTKGLCSRSFGPCPPTLGRGFWPQGVGRMESEDMVVLLEEEGPGLLRRESG